MDFSKQLVFYRKASNLTQEKLASQCNVTRQAVAKWESGLSLPDIYMVKKISGILNVAMEELIGNEDEMNIWKSICYELKKEMTDISYRAWIHPLILKEVNDKEKKICIECDCKFVLDIITKRYLNKLNYIAERLLGSPYKVIICD